MTNKRDALVFVGRMQPLHKGHEAVIRRGLELAHTVVVVLGSCFAAREFKNPFTFHERKEMIASAFPDEFKAGRLKVAGVADYPHDDNKWVAAVQEAVKKSVPDAKDIGLIGHSKDNSSYYLGIFPKWKKHVEVPNLGGINATDIRKVILEEMDYTDFEELSFVISPNVLLTLAGILGKQELINLRQEYKDNLSYIKSWAAAPYPPTFVTTDTLVVQSGHILLIERGRSPGKGLWALPGGFLNQNESIEDCAIRELQEETSIKLQPQVLRGSIVDTHVFDKPDRDPRGRTITHAFYIKLKDIVDLPKVRAADDAAEAMWVPLSEVLENRHKFFNDHFHIISYFLKIG